jgi:probable rRNA maturation factor
MMTGSVPTLDLAFHGPGDDDEEAFWLAHLGAWLGQLAPELPAGLRASGYSLGLELCDDAAIAALNRTWRQQEGPTDVLAFAAQEAAPPPLPDTGEAFLELGDIVISLETARRQASAAGHGLEEELLFLASHGLLHLLGWDHPDEMSLATMLERQTQLLQATAS